MRSALPSPDDAALLFGGRELGEARQEGSGEMQPEGRGVHLLLRHVELAGADVFHGVELDLLEAHDLARDADIAVHAARAVLRSALHFFEHLDLRVIDRVGVVIAIHALDVGLALVVVEALDVELARLVEVDGFFVERGERGGEGDLGDHFGFAGNIHHHEIIAGHGAQAGGIGRVGVAGPVPGGRRSDAGIRLSSR